MYEDLKIKIKRLSFKYKIERGNFRALDTMYDVPID